MDTENTADPTEPTQQQAAPPLPDDPRVPRPEDADPDSGQELGGAAPAVGPGD
jgi:hypothetical protein